MNKTKQCFRISVVFILWKPGELEKSEIERLHGKSPLLKKKKK